MALRRSEPGRSLMHVVNPNYGSGSNTLQASGFRVKQQDADTMRRLIQPWQARAFAYYDLVPEIKYAAQFYSRALAVLRLYPGYVDDQGEIEETETPEAIEQLERIQDPGGGRSSLLASYGRLMFLTGETYLLCTLDRETGKEQWEFLSTDELRVTGATYIRYRAPSMVAENFSEPDDDVWTPVNDQTAIAFRVWKRHPRYSFLADSTMQGVLDICEELVLLTQVVRARARSRLAGPGLLLVNGKVLPAPLEPAPDEDPEEDPFLRELTNAMTAPIVNEGSASAVVPLVLRVDVDDLSQVVKHLQIVDPTQLYPETGLREELRNRLAIGLDMPPEALLGAADANHWTAWQIDEQTWKAHLQPVAQQLCDDLSQSYFRPSLRELGVKDWDRYTIAYDAAAVINHPDRSKDASDLFDRRAIGKHALREAKNFTDEDAPTEEELNEMIGISLRDGSYVKYGEPTVRGGEVETAPGQIVTSDDTSPPASLNGDRGGGFVEEGPPANANEAPTPVTGSGNGNGHGRASEALVARIQGACDMAVLRARELAGNRLRNYAKRDPVALTLIDGVVARQVAPTLGRELASAMNVPNERELVMGGRDAMLDAFRVWGFEQSLVEPLIDRVEQHAARTLFEERPAPLPASFANYVRGLCAHDLH